MQTIDTTIIAIAEFHGIDTENISTTDTIESMLDNGIAEDRIATGHVAHDEVLENLIRFN